MLRNVLRRDNPNWPQDPLQLSKLCWKNPRPLWVCFVTSATTSDVRNRPHHQRPWKFDCLHAVAANAWFCSRSELNWFSPYCLFPQRHDSAYGVGDTVARRQREKTVVNAQNYLEWFHAVMTDRLGLSLNTKNRACINNIVGSVAKRVKTSFLRRPWSHDLGSNPTLASLLCSWIRRFTMIIPAAWWLRISSKFNEQEFEEIHKNNESLETSKQVRILPGTK